jgi:hypothetical protein
MSSPNKISHPLFKVNENGWIKKSRSVRKTPIFNYTTCRSNKWSKKYCHHIFRQKEKMAIINDGLLPIKMDESLSEWDFGGDGKHYWVDYELKYMRK